MLSPHDREFFDSELEKKINRITKTAIKIFHVPVVELALMDEEHKWFKSSQSSSSYENDKNIYFCGHVLKSSGVSVIPDAKKDNRFTDEPINAGKTCARFYAGVSILSTDGTKIGVLYIEDIKPRKFSLKDREILKAIAFWVETEINCRNLALVLCEEQETQAKLRVETKDLERSEKSSQGSKKAFINVMEDLEIARNILKEEKAKDEAILESIGDGVIGTNQDGKVIVINPAGCKLLGFTLSELLGKYFTEAVEMVNENGKVIPNDQRPITKALIGKKSTTTTSMAAKPFYHYVRKDRSQFAVAITVRPIMKGKAIGAIEVFRDITKEKEIDRSKSEFVSLASHQLRTPLGIIKWYLEVLSNNPYLKNAPKIIVDYFSEVVKNNERLLSLVRELLSVSRIDQGRVKDNPKSTNIRKIITDITHETLPVAQKKDIKLNLKIAQLRIPSLIIDPLRFHEVVENLIVNAIEYTPSKGSVLITVKKNRDTLFIAVKDNGIGMSSEEQKKLFTKFYRSQQAIIKNPEGSGLGLYVVKSYVEDWGGKISVKSAPKKGSTFTINLPINQNQKQNEKNSNR